MGTIRFVTATDGADVGLYDHAGYVAQLFDDGTLIAGGSVASVDRDTAGFQAACECGWRGATVVRREDGESAWPEWEDVPDLEAEWFAHTDHYLAALEAHGPGDAQPEGEVKSAQRWSLVDGDIHLPAEEAEWWGATLSILVAAIYQPALLAREQPDTDPAETAEQVLHELGGIREAVEAAEAGPQPEPRPVGTSVVSGYDTATGRVVVISPGGELRQLVWLLEAFAQGVLEPDSHTAAFQSANGHVASAWSRDLGVAAGAIR